MNGTGVLAVWNDRRADAGDRYEYWYQTEHLPERVAVPGFVRGRRYQARAGTPEFFTWYEVDSPYVLFSPPYEERLGAPTPLTREIMDGIFLNASRTACRRIVLRGEMFGAVAVTLRFSAAIDLAQAQAALEGMDDPHVLARAEFWERADAGMAARTEEALRGPDQKIEACLMLEFLREESAEAAAAALASRFPAATAGVYRLLCERR